MLHVVGGRIWQRWYTAELDGILLLPRSHANSNRDIHANTYTYAYTNPMHAAMFAYAEASRQSDGAPNSATSPDTGAASAFPATNSCAAAQSLRNR